MPHKSHDSNVDARLSRLETIIDSISTTLDKIQIKLDQESKINWAPVGIGLTLFITIVSAFGTIYSTRMNATDIAIKSQTEIVQNLAVTSTEQRISVQTLMDRMTDQKSYNKEKFDQIEKRLDALED